MTIRDKGIKLLWGRAGNRCAMPNCRVELSSDEGGGRILGEMVHIKAEKLGGPRWDPSLTPDQRDSYDNLILLCPNHHTEVDNDPAKWPVERLWEMKSEHEAWVAKSGKVEFTEFEGKVAVRAEWGDSVTGAKVTKPTRFKPGTSITVDTRDVRKTIGLQIGDKDDEP